MDLTFWDVIYWGTHVVGIAMVIVILRMVLNGPPQETGPARCDWCAHAERNPRNFMRLTGLCRKFVKTRVDPILGEVRSQNLHWCHSHNRYGQCPFFEESIFYGPGGRVTPPPLPVPDDDD